MVMPSLASHSIPTTTASLTASPITASSTTVRPLPSKIARAKPIPMHQTRTGMPSKPFPLVTTSKSSSRALAANTKTSSTSGTSTVKAASPKARAGKQPLKPCNLTGIHFSRCQLNTSEFNPFSILNSADPPGI